MGYNADFNDTTYKAIGEEPKRKYSGVKEKDRTALQKVIITSANVAGIAAVLIGGYNLVEFGACFVVDGYNPLVHGLDELATVIASGWVLNKVTPTIVKNNAFLSGKWKQIKDVTATWKELREEGKEKPKSR